MGSTLSSPWSRSHPTLSRQDAALAHLDSLHPHDLVIQTDGSVPFPFGKDSSEILAECSLCGTDATFSLSVSPACSSFLLNRTYTILQAICWSRQHQQVCHSFSPPMRLSLCPCHPVSSSVFPFTSNSLAHLTATVFSNLCYEATMGPQTLVSPEEKQG